MPTLERKKMSTTAFRHRVGMPTLKPTRPRMGRQPSPSLGWVSVPRLHRVGRHTFPLGAYPTCLPWLAWTNTGLDCVQKVGKTPCPPLSYDLPENTPPHKKKPSQVWKVSLCGSDYGLVYELHRDVIARLVLSPFAARSGKAQVECFQHSIPMNASAFDNGNYGVFVHSCQFQPQVTGFANDRAIRGFGQASANYRGSAWNMHSLHTPKGASND